MIIDYYVNLRKANPSLNSKRVYESIFRICTAVSKLKLKEVVDSDDVTDATRFYNILISKYLDTVAIIPQDPAKLLIECCKEILRDNKNNTGSSIVFSELTKQVCIENERCRSYLLGGSQTKDIKFTTLSKKYKKIIK
jgi:DNA replicative helicase MCM subunit Mcm2 (Cdc46/Mcm family)